MDTDGRAAFIAKHGAKLGPAKAAEIFDKETLKAEMKMLRWASKVQDISYSYTKIILIFGGVAFVAAYGLLVNLIAGGAFEWLGINPNDDRIFRAAVGGAVIGLISALIAAKTHPTDAEAMAILKARHGHRQPVHNPVDPERL